MYKFVLDAVLAEHAKWLQDPTTGKRANFCGANLYKANFRGANLRRAHLYGANLKYADLTGSDLTKADLRVRDVTGAFLKGAVGLPAAPRIPDIHKQVYEAVLLTATTFDHRLHNCPTTLRRAGWVIVLAGKEGKRLETFYGKKTAAAFIYMASDPTLERIPDWYASNKDTLADLTRLAGL